MHSGRKRPVGKALVRAARAGLSLEGIDTSIVPNSYRDGILEGARPAMEIAEGLETEFTERFNRGADCFVLTAEQRWALRAMTGQKGSVSAKLLCSDIPLRMRLIKELIGQAKPQWFEHRKDPDRQYVSITIITDTGNTLARDPSIDLEALRRRADKLLRQAKLDGVFVIEVQLLTNFPRHGHGASHYWHVHCVATTKGPNFDIETLEAKLQASGRLSNIFGAPTVRITPITTLGHLMRSYAYMLKAPAVGKYLMPHPDIPKAWTFDKVFVRPDEALRLAEAMSHVQLGLAVHSVGEGKQLLRPAMKAVRAWHKARSAKARHKLADDFDIPELWAEVRNARRNNRYQPYLIGKPGTGGPSTEWMAVARRALDAMNAKRASSTPSGRRARAKDTMTGATRKGIKRPPKWARSAARRLGLLGHGRITD